MRSLAPALLAAVALAQPATDTPPPLSPPKEQREPGDPKDDPRAPASEETERSRPGLDHLAWDLLALPERVVELGLAPLGLTVIAAERYRLDRRFYDLLRNDEGTIVLTPRLKVGGGNGFGAGGTLSFKSVRGGEERLDLRGLGRLNGDYDFGARYRQALARLEGRRLQIRAEYELDQDLRHYGFGNDTDAEDRRVMESRDIDANASLDLFARGVWSLRGAVEAGFRRVSLGPGVSGSTQSVGEPGDDVAPPVGFGRTHGYPHLRLSLRYDSRDTSGRPTRGLLTEIETSFTSDVNGADLNAQAGRIHVHGFVPVLPRHRTVVLSLGAAETMPLTEDGQVPFHELVTLGRKNHLRGYSHSRFRDRYGWWGGIEYRFPVYEYMSTGMTLFPLLFWDVGRVGHGADDLFSGPVRYSGGFGFRAATDTVSLLKFEAGFSPEGYEVALSVGDEF